MWRVLTNSMETQKMDVLFNTISLSPTALSLLVGKSFFGDSRYPKGDVGP